MTNPFSLHGRAGACDRGKYRHWSGHRHWSGGRRGRLWSAPGAVQAMKPLIVSPRPVAPLPRAMLILTDPMAGSGVVRRAKALTS